MEDFDDGIPDDGCPYCFGIICDVCGVCHGCESDYYQDEDDE